MFGLVLAFVHWGYVYHFHCIIIEHIPRVSCSVTFCVPCWLLSYTGAYPRPWVHRFSFGDFLAAHSISWPLWVVILGHTPILEFIDVLQTSLITQSISWSLRVIIPRHTSFSAFLLGHIPLSLGLPCLMLISWLSDPFVDLYELSPRASPYYRLV